MGEVPLYGRVMSMTHGATPFPGISHNVFLFFIITFEPTLSYTQVYDFCICALLGTVLIDRTAILWLVH